MLKFNPEWRFQPLPDGIYHTSEIPEEALSDFDLFIGTVATQGKRWSILEDFKEVFSRAARRSYYRSSSESWAESDLSSDMREAAKNAPLFLEAFYDACMKFQSPGLFAPNAAMINAVCEKHRIGYILQPPELLLRESSSATVNAPVLVDNRTRTLTEEAIEILQQSIARSEQLLKEGHHREAVQETLWVLESVTTTAFRGLETTTGEVIRGKYFNKIIDDLRRRARGSTLDRILEWMTNLHGFLSSPTGGGVRHGIDLNAGVQIGPAETRLFCNLIRSYTNYLLAEHEQLTKNIEIKNTSIW
ncbi:hypothetical protein [Candidatus Electronema sp. PJ]|uniref:hypothetical protein n=1 Tax=Candidatus Electronema sp. PJ TaxID=3401572 RepID=UPI003AA92C01